MTTVLLTEVSTRVNTKLGLAGGTLTGPLIIDTISGNGAGLGNLTATNIVGTISQNNLPINIGNTESFLFGNGYNLTSINADAIIGGINSGNGYALFNVNAANLIGTLSSTVLYPEFVGGVDTKFIGSGEFLGALDGSKITKGPIGTQYLPTDILVAGTVQGNTIVANVGGSASVPSINFLNSNTGAFSVANTFAVSVEGVELGRFTPTGLGILTDTPLHALHVVGNVYASQEIIALSDRRMKDNLLVIPDALDKVCQLTGYTYTRNDIETDRRFMGLMAQDAVGVVDEIVHTSNEGMLALSYPNMAGLFVEAFKEMKLMCVQMGDKIAALETKLDT